MAVTPLHTHACNANQTATLSLGPARVFRNFFTSHNIILTDHAIASAIASATHANISQSEYNIDSFQSHKYKNKDCAECDQFIADWEAGGVRQLLYSGSVE